MAHTMTAVNILRNPSSRRRLLVGMSAGPFSCIAGNIIASYYFGSELKTAGITDSNQQLKANVVLNAWCLVCCLIGTHLAAKSGRKITALLSQFLLTVFLYTIGGLTKKYSEAPDRASSSLVYGNVAVIFLFQGFYSLAWTPLLYLYPPEVMNFKIRAHGQALSSFTLNSLAYCVPCFQRLFPITHLRTNLFLLDSSSLSSCPSAWKISDGGCTSSMHRGT